MASDFDQTEFVDTDFESSNRGEESQRRPSLPHSVRPPSREQLENRVGEAQQKLAELRRAQEELERERAALEEARRRRVEYQNGREEMLQHLTRGVGLLTEAEFTARRSAEQMSKTIVDLRDALNKVESLNEESWTQENWSAELTRALTTLENARMEWNSARLKWTLLDGTGVDGTSVSAGAAAPKDWTQLGFGELAKIGFALTWPIALVAGIGITGIIVLLLQK